MHVMTRFLIILSLALTLPLSAQTPEPGPEHHKLTSYIGVWDAKIERLLEGKTTTSKGTSVRKQPLGGFWLVDHFQAEIMGQSVRGLGTTGFDPIKKKYVATWHDSMNPTLMVMEGNFDKSGKVLTMHGMAPDAAGNSVNHRLTTTFQNNNTHIFEMFVTGANDKDLKVMRIVYTRRVKILDRVPGK